MIPLVVTSQELASLARGPSTRSQKWRRNPPELDADVEIGTMIETPRAALRAKEIAEDAQFFSFGTNDLTQMTFGFQPRRHRSADHADLPRARAVEGEPVRHRRRRRGR
jgi:phosphoenolpyruvate-protein kinase (PTS system EI component)